MPADGAVPQQQKKPAAAVHDDHQEDNAHDEFPIKGEWEEIQEITTLVIGDVNTVAKPSLGPKWRREFKSGYQLKLVMDSGAIKTLCPTIPSQA